MSKAFVVCVFAAVAMTSLSADAKQPRRDEQDRARDALQNGQVRPLRTIENAIVPRMESQGASYIGQEFYGEDGRYRLKFMRGKSVIWVDVDGRTGAIIGQAGG